MPCRAGGDGWPPTAPRASVSTHAIREWARANGYDLPDRGRIPIEIIKCVVANRILFERQQVIVRTEVRVRPRA
ncbi:Lsr2 family DNA-binding protein [Streptomyces sp. WMMC940]|uniref:Lsr2 family DNA-binding protein n=1 Tax=Streptomyces sp. WMMC940 TaxID=3015153 RepID=UPI0022B655F8|nr:histone-like nucleoid-structuring protein Lsr2 [Streptomyces sp. WMMC940]MCZ7456212.1 Lsr2 family protein [Streptomyces sp. WMMC940]